MEKAAKQEIVITKIPETQLSKKLLASLSIMQYNKQDSILILFYDKVQDSYYMKHFTDEDKAVRYIEKRK